MDNYRFNLKNKQVQDIEGSKVITDGADYVVLTDDGSEVGRVRITETTSYVKLPKPNPDDFFGAGGTSRPRP